MEPGTWTRPNGEMLSPISEVSVAWAVMPTGRVWGTAIGMPCALTASVMPRRIDRARGPPR
jgi:hypothetical protein